MNSKISKSVKNISKMNATTNNTSKTIKNQILNYNPSKTQSTKYIK